MGIFLFLNTNADGVVKTTSYAETLCKSAETTEGEIECHSDDSASDRIRTHVDSFTKIIMFYLNTHKSRFRLISGYKNVFCSEIEFELEKYSRQVQYKIW